MADQSERGERKIPVFSVWKNNAILKNIFLINAPPSLNQTITHDQENQECNQNVQETYKDEFEETLVVGRHPDCDIRLEHPSISRFHLRIHSKPNSTHLSLTDLSSVHGTWVSGKRLEPNVRTRLNEGETLRIGGSSRVYKLHWIPLSRAYDMEHPFVPPLDYPEIQEEDEEEIIKDENSLRLQNDDVHVDVVNSVSEVMESLVLCDDEDINVEEVVPEAPPLQQQNNLEVINEDVHVDVVNSVSEGLESLVLCDEDINVEEGVSEVPPLQQQNTLDVIDEDGQVHVVNSVSKGLEPFVLCDDEDLVEEEVVPEAPMLFKQENTLEVRNGDIDLNPVLEGLESLVLDENSKEFVQKEIPPVHLMLNDNSEVQENDEGQAMDSVLDGLVPLFMGENWEWVGQEKNHSVCPAKSYDPLPVEHEDEGFVGSVLQGLNTSSLDENIKLIAQNIIPSAPPMPEDMAFHLSPKLGSLIADGAGGSDFLAKRIQENEEQSPLRDDVQPGAWDFWYGSLLAPSSPATKGVHSGTVSAQHESEPKALSKRKCLGTHNVYPNSSGKEHTDCELWSWSGKLGVESLCSSLSDAEALSELGNNSLRDGYQSPLLLSSVKKQLRSPLMTPEPNSASSIWSRRGKQASAPQILTSRTKKTKGTASKENVKHDPISRTLFHGVDDQEEEEIFTPDKENYTPSTHKSMRKMAVLNEAKLSKSGKSSLFKMASSPDIYTENCMSPSSDKENFSRALFHEVDDQEEEEIFTPDKENFTPNTHKTMRKMAVLNELKHSTSAKSSLFKMADSPDYQDGRSPTSDKGKILPNVLRELSAARHASINQAQSVRLKERKGQRVPFQPLLADSPQKSVSETCTLDAAAMRSGNSVSCAKATSKTHLQDKCCGERTRKWNMVVDTTTLLNKESRKALQLLEGLKGTQLIIPRIVIKELDCLKRQSSFFRRNVEVSSALEWIQDCMVKTQTWIHVQSSIDEGRSVAPTPPASPQSQFSCGTATSVPFFGFGSVSELLSPTPDDHVLDYALSFRKTRNDGQLVLLSDDVTLKIKAIAEGLICEEAEEFRESLVNPFSERFLWADSSPRGQTWCCADDILLREKFYPSSLKMTPKAMESVKGLKLILLHNSQYFERMTAIH